MIPGITPREYYQTAIQIARDSPRTSRARVARRVARYWLRLIHAKRQAVPTLRAS